MLALLPLLAATILGPADVGSLTAASDVVVHARVLRRTAAWGAGGEKSGQIFTRVVLEPVETWKGELSRELAVLVPGGTVGDLDQLVQGVASFRDGEEVVVFLQRRAHGVYSVSRWALGKFSVGAAKASLPKRALRDRSGILCQGCGADEADDLSLDELRARVLGSVRK
jgi:hypothetical protein